MNWEGSFRVPAFIKPPGQLEAGTFHGLFHVVDVLPTVLGFLRSSPSSPSSGSLSLKDIDGIDLSRALSTLPESNTLAAGAATGDGDHPREASTVPVHMSVRTTAVLGISTFQRSFALRSGRWKLIAGPAGDDNIYKEPINGLLFGDRWFGSNELEKDEENNRREGIATDRPVLNPPSTIVDIGCEVLGNWFNQAWGEEGGGHWFVVSFVAMRMLLRDALSLSFRHRSISLPRNTFSLDLSEALDIASLPLEIVKGDGILPCVEQGL